MACAERAQHQETCHPPQQSGKHLRQHCRCVCVWCSHVQLHDMHRSRTALNLGGTRMKLLRGDRGLVSIAAVIAMAVVLVFGVDAASAARSAAGSLSSSSVVDAAPTPAAGCTVKPTIVLVHGAWANAASWSGEIDRLQRDGYVVRAVANPLRGLTSDAASVADFLSTQSGPIVRSSPTPPSAIALSRRWSMSTPPRPPWARRSGN
jgi:pimeloyl-ACP methyl ester carboxylesterase